ncbi:type I DNA topoisomerase [Candidatus Wolfebacteria bacterium]|nr:type I DNA topoisomerase [Candidatus Wolfebacteria bacterium]
MSKLVIVESPAKAKTIQKYLGDDFVVLASVGHVRDLPKSNKDAVDIENGFIPRYVNSPRKEDVIADIKKAAKKATEVFLAPDPDREGEAIAWHVQEAADIKKAKRVVFHEVTKDAVLEAMKHPREIDMNLLHAQEARRVLDRLVGYDLSGLIWKKVRYGLSAGRVQSPALRILMEREREIRKFIPETYFVLEALFKAIAGEFQTTAKEEPREAKEAERIAKEAKEGSWSVESITESKQKRQPKAPFTTSTIQQVASTRLGFSPSRTMRAAQKLYEAGRITYMRTDSTTLSKEAVTQISKAITDEYGKENLEVKTFKTKSKNAQEAHEAVRPTEAGRKTAGRTDDEKRLYQLIRTRTLASQMISAEIMRTKIVAVCDKDIPTFAATGSRVINPGWLACDTEARGEDKELPKVSQGDSLDLLDVTSTEKQTEPPNRYTEAGLIKELEKRGIGRPSTYASTIRTIVTREYVEKIGRTLFPTAVGDVVSSFLEEHFTYYVGDDFTAEMENRLDDIAAGTGEYVKTLTEFYGPFRKALESKEDIPKLTNLGPVDKKFKCPKCGKGMHKKLGRGGIFMSCDTYPDCDGMRTQEGEEIAEDKPIGNHPESGEEIYVLSGRFGPYVQLGVKDKENKKPRRASVPKDKEPKEVTIADAVKYLSLPRVLGDHPVSGEPITASIGRFGPYIVHESDFRSLKTDDVYNIELKRALEILAEEKKKRGAKKKK